MATEIIMPKLGLTMTCGRINKWLKNVGDPVKAGEVIVEIETDKINSEVESTVDGVVLEIYAAEGEEREITVPICLIGAKGENSGIKANKNIVEITDENVEIQLVKADQQKAERIFITPYAKKLAFENKLDYSAVIGTGPGGRIVKADILKAVSQRDATGEQFDAGRIRISPLAKRMADENGIDYTGLQGSGPNGRIVKEDILSAIEENKTPNATVTLAAPINVTAGIKPQSGRRVPLTGMRKVIAQRLSQSKHDIPHVYFKANIDATQMIKLKNEAAELVKAKTGKRLSINEIIIKAVAVSLGEFPDINASLIENEIIYHENVNIGMAVSVPQGLVVPVIRQADRMSLSEINRSAGDLAEKARSGKLTMDEMSGGTFTISNLGAYGIDEFSAIINPPESAILAVGRAVEMPCVENGQIVVKSKMVLTLSVDHRIIDGALAATFMKRLRELLENPYLLLI